MMANSYDKATTFFDEAFADLGLDEDGPYNPDEEDISEIVSVSPETTETLKKINESMRCTLGIPDHVWSWMEEHYTQ